MNHTFQTEELGVIYGNLSLSRAYAPHWGPHSPDHTTYHTCSKAPYIQIYTFQTKQFRVSYGNQFLTCAYVAILPRELHFIE